MVNVFFFNNNNDYFISVSERPFLNPQTVQFCKEIDIENKINVGCRERIIDEPTTTFNCNTTGFVPGTGSNNVQINPSRVQVDATFIDTNLQPTKRFKTEDEIQSEIVIDDEEFL